MSGLPIRNGSKHAGEVASMALHLLERIKSFEIRHRPSERLKLRIGIHSGKFCQGWIKNRRGEWLSLNKLDGFYFHV